MADFRETRSLRSEKQAEELRRAQAKRDAQRARLKKAVGWALTLGVAAALLVVGRAMLGPVRLSPLNDAFSLVGRRGEGFPIDFSYSHTRQAALLGQNLALLGPTRLDVVTRTGYPGLNFEQPYALPSVRAAGGRIALFDRGSGKLTLLSRSEQLYDKDLGRDIFALDLNKNGTVAAAAKSDGGACEIFAWDAREKECFAWRCEKEHPSALRLSDNGRSLGICLVGTEKAGVYARFVEFAFGAKEPRTDLRVNGAWLYGASAVSGGWLAVGDRAVYRIDSGGDNPQAFSYEGRALDRFDMENNGYCAVLLEDWDNRALLRLYDRRAALVLEQGFKQRPLEVSCRGGSVYLRFDNALLRWQKSTGFRQSQALPPGTQGAFVAGRDAYLLTVRQVELMRVKWGAPEEGVY